MARKPFVVTHAIREKVRHLAGLGVPVPTDYAVRT
jgi:hypothetical protein